jgi:4-oxalocrotonate tautomerase
MENKFSRRDFVTKTTLAAGILITGGFSGVTNISGIKKAFAAPHEKIGDEIMPHVNIKLWPGRSEDEKKRLAAAVVRDVVEITGCSERSVSVAIEDIPSDEWKEKVYDPEIKANEDILYKKPGYSM